MYGLIVSKALRKQFLDKVLEASGIESGDSVPDFDFSAHQSHTLLRFLRQSKCSRLKTVPNRHGKLDDMTCAALARARLSEATRFRTAAHASPLLTHGADHQGVLIDPVAEHLAAQVSHGHYRARWAFPMLKAVIDRALLLLIRIPRPAMLPFQELIDAELALLSSVAEHDTI